MKLFFVNSDELFLENADALEYCKSLCCAERLAKLRRLKNADAKKSCVAAELALIGAVRFYYPAAPLPLRYERNEYGKPYLTDYKELYVNISHSGSWAVCAASEREIGVDIQRMKRADMRIAERFFTPGELEYINGDEERFFEIWARREARVKAEGTGITMPLDSFSAFDENGYEYRSHTAPEPGYVLWTCELK